MLRMSHLSELSDVALDRAIRRLLVLVAVVAVGFLALYTLDRWRAPAPSVVDQRIASLESAVRADPEDVAARGQLADVYVAAGRYADAIAQYDAILGTDESTTLAHLSRGRAYLAIAELDAAAADFEAVVDALSGGEMANVDPNLELAYYWLGSIALDQGRPDDAVSNLEHALAITRSDADALYLLGRAYVAVGRPSDAVTALRRAIDFVPIGWPEPYRELAAAYAAQGDGARQAWAGAMALMQAGDVDTAETALRGLLGGDAGVDARVALGLIAEMRGDAAAATGWYDQALALDPDNVSALMALTRVRPAADPSGGELPALPAPVTGGGEG